MIYQTKKYCLVALLVFFVSDCFSQTGETYCSRFANTVRIFNENSISPVEQEKFNTEKFRNQLIRTLDPDAVLFNPEDIHNFSSVGNTLKQDLNNAYCKDKDLIIRIYTESLKNALSLLDKLNNIKTDFAQQDSFYMGESFFYNNYQRTREIRWLSFVKFHILQEVVNSTAKYDSLKQNQYTLDSLIETTKRHIIAREKNHLQYFLDRETNTGQFVYDAYINSLLTQFDPYSYSFSEEAFRKFREQLSSCAQSFGIQLELEKDHKLIISSIIPGSYAWRSGKINTGDEIIKVQTENADPLIIKDSQIEDIRDYLSSTSNEKLMLTLTNSYGEQKEITIYRENLEQMENSVQSLILKGESKSGYILLPAFYTSWDSENASGCAQDVGKAIYRLKKENIESLIIDLRNNGGGSITEAIDLAGIFIDFGTLSIGQKSDNTLFSIKDFNRGTMYSGPLAILINNNSASASEMVVAVLQDYNRAIITGDTSYGKACGQSLLPVSRNRKDMLKVTTNNYYRVSGKSYAGEGVVPDILLPQIKYSQPGYHTQKGYRFAFLPVNKKVYFTPLDSIPVQILRKKSADRIEKNDRFKAMSETETMMNNVLPENEYLQLNFERYYAIIKTFESLYNKDNPAVKIRQDAFAVDYLETDREMMNMYKYYADLLTELSESVVSDPYIEETYHILQDYITIKK